MEDLLVDREQWIVVDHSTAPTGMSREDWTKLERKERSTIWLCLSYSMLLNVSEETTTKALWDKLGNLYQLKSLVNKLFLRKRLYHISMEDGDSVTKHLNSFNTLVIELVYVDIKLTEEDKCIVLLCSFPDSQDNMVVAIGSTTKSTLAYEDVVTSLLLEDMRWNNMDSQSTDVLFARGRPQDRNKNKSSRGGGI
jgi:hypothetical protein